MNETNERCFDCEFSWGTKNQGLQCRFDPPTVLPSGESAWPTVDNSDWCGKFEPMK